jgi:hypothetical protein
VNPLCGFRIVRQKRCDLLIVRVEIDADDVQAATSKGSCRDPHAGADIEGGAGERARLVQDELRGTQPVVASAGEPVCLVREVRLVLLQLLNRQRHTRLSAVPLPIPSPSAISARIRSLPAESSRGR